MNAVPSLRRVLHRAGMLAVAVSVAFGALTAAPAEALPDQRLGYGFGEGSGTAVNDTSANNTDATATNPTWTTSGRYGNAITFNGTSTRVRSTSDIALNTAFTLEAWVLNPTNQAFETIMTIGGNRDVYLNNGTLNLYTGTTNYTFGNLATNTWQHVAIVSDGTTVRAYVDAAPQGNPQNATLSATTDPLQIGAWIEGGSNSDYFSGTLDEIRVYNRALTTAEITTDRNTPVSSDGPGTDSTPPIRSGGQPSGALPSGTTQAALQLTTDEAASCRYSTTPGTAYAAMTSTFATTGTTAHSTMVTGLTNGGSYSYQVRCRDTAGNANTTDLTISFSVANGGGSSQLGPWNSTTSLPSARSVNGAVHANGYLYLVGGIDGAGTAVSTVYVAPVNANGTVDSWTTTTPVPSPVRSVRPVYFNGYLYVAGGSNGPSNSSTVYNARINANGTLGAWATTTPLPQAQLSHAVVADNGFLYIIGGNPGSCISTVRSARINTDGSLGSWNTTSTLPDARCGIVESATVYNGRVYIVAGFNNIYPTSTVLYAQINGNGTLGAWQSNGTTLNTQREYTAVEAANGVLYVLGGQTEPFGGVTGAVEQASINANGSVGSFSAATSLPGPRAYLASELVNGVLYVLGGGTAISGGTAQPSVWYATVGGGGAGDQTPPTRSNASPSGTLPAGTTQVTLALTTDEAATCRYGTTSGTAYAALPNTFGSTGATTHSTTVNGLSNAAYSFFVRCIDGTGNANTSDLAISFTIGGGTDTVAPTATVTAPAAGTTVSGTVTVTANASDNVEVGGVQFLLDGTALGAEDTTAPYSVSWDSTTATNGAHTISARARDAAGNQATSSAITVTVSNGAAPGSRVSYRFGEGSGTAVNDTSANNTDATATNPTWTTSGRYGNAITFNGTSTRVRSTSDIALNTAFTLEAWVLNPTNQAFETIMTIGGNRDVYLNNGTLNLYTGTTNYTFGNLATNTWQHVAIVSDGTTVRAYVDAAPQGNPQNATLSATTDPLQIGAWIEGGSNSDYFSGTLDEIRVYNRALTTAEITTDRNTPID